jgi:hypothetical protein
VYVDGIERSASTKASVDVCWAGVETGGGTVAVAAGAESVVLVSTTGTAADLGALGTVWNLSVVGLSSPLSSVAALTLSTSSLSFSTIVCTSVIFTSRS